MPEVLHYSDTLLVGDDFEQYLLHYSAENLTWHCYYIPGIQE